MFVDVAKVELHAGKGGDGAVSFRHEIYIPKGGPDGGDGGKGGSIIFRADKDTNTLLDFRYNPILRAEDGKNGSGQRSAGRSGKDLIVEVPIGTMVYKVAPMSKLLLADLVTDGQEAVIARGGEGGFGNAHFKSSTRQTPKIAEVGEPGEEFIAELELKLLADVGLVGLPNAGKSTFLASVSNAKPEIADYPFTTITPNLGVATIDDKDLLIADIPGLIEGAADGKGLGHNFLRHIDRTAVLLHLVDVYNDDAGRAYKTIRDELAKYSDLKDRPEIVALTKCEGLDEEIIKMQTANILRENPDAKVFAISALAHQGVTELLRELMEYKMSSRNGLERTRFEEGAHLSEYAMARGAAQAERPNENRTRAKQPRESSSYIPVIKLSDKALKDTWSVEKDGDKFVVTGEKIEKFARKTDLSNYASLNRLRDVMKKMGIRAELTNQGAGQDSIISIAGKEFTLVEDY
ncbi:GTPase ObgE [Candidatus Saccharibacteria bacterium]|nr:GTPase ObgE [Candidatus Saccharibacteria bacterium]